MPATLRKFSSLNSQERLALGVLAACGEPVEWEALSVVLGQRRSGWGLPVKPAVEVTQALFARLIKDGLVSSRGRKMACPDDLVAPALETLRLHPGFRQVVDGVRTVLPASRYGTNLAARLQRDFRLLVELGDPRQLAGFLASAIPLESVPEYLELLSPDPGQFWKRSPAIQNVLLDRARLYSLAWLRPLGRLAGLLGDDRARLLHGAVQHHVLCGDLSTARRLLSSQPLTGAELEASAWVALGEGDWEFSASRFEAALKVHRGQHGNRWVFPGLSSQAYLWACLGSGRRAKAERYLKATPEATHLPTWTFEALVYEVPSQQTQAQVRAALEGVPQFLGVDSLARGLVVAWRFSDLGERYRPWLETNAQAAETAGYRWLAQQLRAVVDRLEGRPVPAGQLVELVVTEEPWQQHLSALRSWSRASGTGSGSGEGRAVATETRLVWDVSHGSLVAKEQKRKGQGWGAGKVVSTTRLHKEPPACLSPQDRRVCAHLHKDEFSRTPEFGDRAWLELVNHPLVYSDGQPVQVVRQQPCLRLLALPRKRFKLELRPALYEPISVDFSQPGEVRVCEIPLAVRSLYGVVGAGLEFPEKAQSQLMECVAELDGLVSVEALLGKESLTVADPTPCLLLSPLGEGLQIQIRVRPFGSQGPAVRPGQGSSQSLAQVGGQLSQARRDHTLEREHCEAVLTGCPSLREAAEWNWDFSLGELDSSLACLEELQALGETVRLEWPQGQRWTLRPQLKLTNLTLSLKAERDWFALRGEVALDEGRVLALRELLELAEAQRGRFVQLGEGEFLALTHELRRRLDELSRVTERSGKKLLVHPLAGTALEALSEAGARVDADEHWLAHLKRLDDARKLVPAVPTTLQAELRPYQEAGYQWLARLAYVGAGACLADDMGLGKTLQALAVLLAQAEHGPSLVVCPTSVGFNWLQEAQRFGPNLRFAPLGPSRERQAQLAGLGPGDVLLVTYGLLHNAAEALSDREWQVIVLDEAHYVKNSRAKRAQAASALRGRVRIALTGTPVENHLGELWSIFRFLNPGLLGSEKSFGERFARPIERKDRAAAQTLRSLLAPFTLRRLKSQVLDDLPPRTEIVRYVELEGEERALYEAARQRAAERVASGEGSELFHVLAELTRLRRLCCHPRLLVPESSLPGAKLDSFLALLDELRENRHRALVFSQFVDHLSVVRENLDQRGVSYLYLDGQTPAAARGGLVQQFQTGQTDVFLISLKAGGTGLNLTAADYVIHLDPWWNPAVEDQATDRAHRIGQQRPVTVYRLVTRDTIEEQILELHQHKRDLADQLLEGQDGEVRLGVEELVALLRG